MSSSAVIQGDHRKSQLGPYFEELDEITAAPEIELSSPSSGNATEDEKEEPPTVTNGSTSKLPGEACFHFFVSFICFCLFFH